MLSPANVVRRWKISSIQPTRKARDNSTLDISESELRSISSNLHRAGLDGRYEFESLEEAFDTMTEVFKKEGLSVDSDRKSAALSSPGLASLSGRVYAKHGGREPIPDTVFLFEVNQRQENPRTGQTTFKVEASIIRHEKEYRYASKGMVVKTAASLGMDRRTIQAINADLRRAGFDGNGRFRSITHAHSAAGNVLNKHGYEFTDILSAHSTMDEARPLMLEVSRSNEADPFSPEPVDNTALSFSYTKLAEGRVEVVAYLGN